MLIDFRIIYSDLVVQSVLTLSDSIKTELDWVCFCY